MTQETRSAERIKQLKDLDIDNEKIKAGKDKLKNIDWSNITTIEDVKKILKDILETIR